MPIGTYITGRLLTGLCVWLVQGRLLLVEIYNGHNMASTVVHNAHENNGGEFPQLIDLNVGGVTYSTTLDTLTGEAGSLLESIFTGKKSISKDSKGRYFIDRDGVLFRYVLDYLRNKKLLLPENFLEKERLRNEADYYRLPNMVKSVNNAMPPSLQVKLAPTLPISSPNEVRESTLCPPSPTSRDACLPGYITIAYRGTFAFGRDGLADVKFRKLTRILVCGRVSLCRLAFGETLNESRDPDRGTDDRYTSRFFLKHTFLEQAFDMLQDAGFKMVGSCGSGTNSSGEIKPGMESEESKWNHFNEFIFYKS